MRYSAFGCRRMTPLPIIECSLLATEGTKQVIFGNAIILCLLTAKFGRTRLSVEAMHLSCVPCFISLHLSSAPCLIYSASYHCLFRVSSVLRIVCSVSHLFRVSSVPCLICSSYCRLWVSSVSFLICSASHLSRVSSVLRIVGSVSYLFWVLSIPYLICSAYCLFRVSSVPRLKFNCFPNPQAFQTVSQL